eukprot:SAG31_NODE_16201_length_719_cov_0.570968_1_plen_32_part_10
MLRMLCRPTKLASSESIDTAERIFVLAVYVTR